MIKGLPDCLRGEVWKKLSKYEKAKTQNDGKYLEYVKQPSKWADQIDLDINRSFRNHFQFKERFGSGYGSF